MAAITNITAFVHWKKVLEELDQNTVLQWSHQTVLADLSVSWL